MLPSIVEILEACAAQLDDALQNQSDFDIHIEPMWFPIAEKPSIDMYPGSPSGLEAGLAGFTSRATYGGFPITIRALVAMADGEAGQQLLYGMMDDDGPLSIVGALGADPTLGGVCDSLTWGTGYPWNGVQPYADVNGDGSFAGSEMSIIVVKTQS